MLIAHHQILGVPFCSQSTMPLVSFCWRYYDTSTCPCCYFLGLACGLLASNLFCLFMRIRYSGTNCKTNIVAAMGSPLPITTAKSNPFSPTVRNTEPPCGHDVRAIGARLFLAYKICMESWASSECANAYLSEKAHTQLRAKESADDKMRQRVVNDG